MLTKEDIKELEILLSNLNLKDNKIVKKISLLSKRIDYINEMTELDKEIEDLDKEPVEK